MPIVVEVKTGDTIKFEQAQQDIVVYKVLLRHSTTLKIKSMFYRYTWSRSRRQQVVIGIFERVPHYKSKTKEYLISKEGLYSFKTENTARRFHEIFSDAKQFLGYDVMTIEAVIPRGTMYFKHKDQIISEELRLFKKRD